MPRKKRQSGQKKSRPFVSKGNRKTRTKPSLGERKTKMYGKERKEKAGHGVGKRTREEKTSPRGEKGTVLKGLGEKRGVGYKLILGPGKNRTGGGMPRFSGFRVARGFPNKEN